MKDVLINAPVATLRGSSPAPLEVPPVEELYRITHVALQDERRAKQQLADFAAEVSSLCLSLTKMLVDAGKASEDDTVTIPLWLHKQMLGASITTGEDVQGNRTVKINERGRERIHAVQ
ncbi:MAG: hypothetical protein H0W31_00280 [Actinobacteria bacterium]|nr:hypothetical protein [Actinomycetota bacterium]